jgi:hypothetical protein
MLATIKATAPAAPVRFAGEAERRCLGRPPEQCLEAGCALALRVRRWVEAMEPRGAADGLARQDPWTHGASSAALRTLSAAASGGGI